MEKFLQDIRYGLRILAKEPGPTAVIVLLLALGIGANSSVFTFFNATLLRPLPYQNPKELVVLQGWRKQASFQEMPTSYPNFADMRQQNQVFSQMGAYAETTATLTGREGAEQITSIVASAGFFETLGVKPALGRTFRLDEEMKSGGPVMLTYAAWQKRYGQDPSIIGKTLVLDGEARPIVGVLPRDFQFGPSHAGEIWEAVELRGWRLRRNVYWLTPVGRLKPGTSLQQAQSFMTTVTRQLEQQYPSDNAGISVQLVSLEEQLIGPAKPVLQLLMAAVAFVLLITCANVAGLLLARSVNRQKEISVRVALGASRTRILRQLLTESVLLSLIGGFAGVLLAYWTVPAIIAAIPQAQLDYAPVLQGLGVSWGVLLFSLGLSLVTGITFGLFPAFQILKPSLHKQLQDAGRSSVGGTHHRVRNVLVVSEMALAMVLLAGAGLMLQSLRRVLNVDPGFTTSNLLTLTLALPQQSYRNDAQQIAFQRNVLQTIGTLPGVSVAAANTLVPLAGSGNTSRFDREDHPKSSGGEEFEASSPTVSANYFSVMGIPLRAGRFFTLADNMTSKHAVMINQALADQVFHGENPVGKRLNYTYTDKPDLWEVIGVVANENIDRLDHPMQPIIYRNFEQDANSYISLLVRTNQKPESLADSVQRKIHEIDPDIPVFQIASMAQLISDSPSMLLRSFPAYLLGIFAALALLLSAMGIYGLLAYSVAQRTRELGLRMALGAQPSQLLRLVLRNGLRLIVIGAALGIAGAFGASRLIASLLFNVKPTDIATFAVICLLLVCTALLASYIPARRATRIDPMVALRWE